MVKKVKHKKTFPLFKEGQFMGENMNGLKDLKMKVAVGLA